jgi:tetratricopeptide (TPR) repeat protein
MGVVWLAEQLATKQLVAVKYCPGARFESGPNSRMAQRFERELELAARLSHPSIARVFGGGEVDGIPYSVMEYVEGTDLATHARAKQLDHRQIVALLAEIADSVQHAHQNGIIHRDLKPSNILVDAKNHPKVLDFGLAKALGESEARYADLSYSGQLLGTPRYMAPEQVRGSSVDTRTDVYALGVILYELLTGKHPQDTTGSLDALLHRIAFDEPYRPRAVCPALDNELEMLLLKALNKGKEDRYRTAGEFADDLRRWLRHEPLSAGRATAFYFAKKWLRRHRMGAIASIVLIAVSTWAVIFYVQSVRHERDRAERANEILASVFDKLDPREERLNDEPLSALLGQRLDEAARLLESETAGDRRSVARMQVRLAQGFIGLGYPERAIPIVSKARQTLQSIGGVTNPDTLSSMHTLARALRGLGKQGEALALFRETLAGRAKALGQNHEDTLKSMSSLAVATGAVGNLEEAVNIANEAYRLTKTKLGSEDVRTLDAMHILTRAYKDAGMQAEAVNFAEEVYAMRRTKLGQDHPDTLDSMSDLAIAYRDSRQFTKAIPLYEEVLRMRTAKVGRSNPDTLTDMNNLAVGYWAAGMHQEALALSEETLKLMKVRFGPDHPNTLHIMGNLAICYQEVERLDEALSLYTETLELMRVKLGPEHPDTLNSMNNLADGYRAAGRLGEALPLFEETLRLRRLKLGPDHPDTIDSMRNLAEASQDSGSSDKAVELFNEALATSRKKLGPEDPNTMELMHDLAVASWLSGNPKDAVPLLGEVYAINARKLGRDHKQTLESMGDYAEALTDAGRSSDAELLLRENLSLREAKGTRDWMMYKTQSLLGGALLQQQKATEADSLLTSAFEGLKSAEASIPTPSRGILRETADRLLKVSQSMQDEERVKHWESVLQQIKD